MYKISVPININTVNDENREFWLSTLKKCGVQRIFFCGGLSVNTAPKPEYLEKFKKYIRFFTENGFEAFLWVSTIGHGMVLSHLTKSTKKLDFTLMKAASGAELDDTYCPLDKGFSEHLSKWVADLCASGAKTIMLDDDFRMAQRGQDGYSSVCCCCDHHLKYMSELLSEPVTLETIKNEVLIGKPGKYRNAWLKAQGDGLRTLAKQIRNAVDKVDSSVRIALSSAWSNWDLDGADALELATILAGHHKPLLRLHGAPYWQKFGMYNSTPISVTELERMLASFCREAEVELFTEGDTYPRPSFNCPAAHLEVFDGMQRANGEINGILKYIFDYVADPTYEQGYVKAHLANLPSAEKLSKEFSDGQSIGVRVYSYPHLLKVTDIEDPNPVALSNYPQISASLLSENGIPTIYEGQGLTSCVFGSSAYAVPLDALNNGAIIDSSAAKTLLERGVDIGANGFCERNIAVSTEYFGKTVAPVSGSIKIRCPDLKPTAQTVSFVKSGDTVITTSYKYENENGQRFFVLCFDAASAYSGLRLNYLRKQSLYDAIQWLSGKKLQIFCANTPYLYSVIKTISDKVKIALFNCCEDEVIEPTLELDKSYSSVRFIKGSGRLEENKLVLDTNIPAYKYVAFELS